MWARKSRKIHHRVRWILIAVAAVGLLAGIVRLVVDPLLGTFTQKALNSLPGYEGSFSRVHLGIFTLHYFIKDVKLVKEGPDEASAPLVYAREINARLLWSELLHFRLAAEANIDHLKATVVAEPGPAKPTPDKKPSVGIPDVAAMLRKVIPLRIERVEVRDSEFLLIDPTEVGVPKRSAELWIHHIEATAENIGTRRDLLKGQPSLLALHAEIQRSGKLTVFVTADPLADKLNFSGQASLQDLKLAELYGFLASKTGVQSPEGTVDVFVSFRCKDGVIDGAIKPELKNAHLEAAESNLGDEIKARWGNAALDLTSDRVPGRNATVAIVPIKGRITDPKAEVWPTVLTVVRNAYVSGISSGFSHLPLATADKSQGPVKQAEQALSSSSFPKAQPKKE